MSMQGRSTDIAVENSTETYRKLTTLHFRIPPVTAGVDNDPHQLSDLLDCQEYATPGNRIKFLRTLIIQCIPYVIFTFIHSVRIDNSTFERVDEFKYLGTTLTNQNSIQEEIKSRLRYLSLLLISS